MWDCEAAMAVQLLESKCPPAAQCAAAIAEVTTSRLYSGQGWLYTTSQPPGVNGNSIGIDIRNLN